MLTRVRTHNDMIAWIKFFLEAVIETSKTAKEKFRSVVELTMEMDKIIVNLPVKSDNVKKVIDTSKDCSRMPRDLVIFDNKIYRSKK